ncbi:DAK2 domain-containing protein [Beduini massiliensis]|uniref:DAK2 domain-containing protein n=1 Tax=Beduini massiliensis TaxID=1585974 RepID=UPI00059AB634|nr:DAK2 domain-containing protein [Beduini massiliensis]
MEKINGQLFKEMILAGCYLLHNQHHEIDALNVFPVPDGDTGTNMSLTFSSGAKEIENMDTSSIYDISKKLSKGLLMGARGNSGVILSQIFRGVSIALEGKDEIDCVDLAKAFKNGAKVAYKAVMRPVEGTILTVIREASDAVVKYAKKDKSIEDVFSYFVKQAEDSLERTPELLPVLKEVGVVDSGGAGLVLILTGFMSAIAGDKIEKVDVFSEVQAAASNVDTGEEGFGYCTEFILRLEESLVNKFSEDQLKNELSMIPGESIVVVQDEDIVKVHVHTLKPGEALNLAQRFGEFIKLKIENMQEQHNTIIEEQAQSAKTEAPREEKEVGLISVAAGSGIKDMFMELNCDYVVSGGQTMNPSTEDLVAAITSINAKNVIVLPNNSNIIMAANQAAVVLEGKVNVKVIPTRTIPQGLSACIMFNPEAHLEDTIEDMMEAVNNVKTGQVTFAIKDTNIDGIDIKANQYMAMVEKSIVACVPSKVEACKETLNGLFSDEDEIITLIAGDDVSKEELDDITHFIEENSEAELEVHLGMQPIYSFIVGVE